MVVLILIALAQLGVLVWLALAVGDLVAELRRSSAGEVHRIAYDTINAMFTAADQAAGERGAAVRPTR
jgi:hypothetical protein